MNSSLLATSDVRQSTNLAGNDEFSRAFLRRWVSLWARAEMRLFISATILSSTRDACALSSRLLLVKRSFIPVATGMNERFTSSKRDDKAQASLVLDKIVAEMKSRISARAHKETQRRKNALENSSLPAKLVDCRTSDVANSELFIVEGDSALGTAKLGRDSEYQALLPIRGKILNVQKASVSDMLGNAECASIIQVIGAGSGRTFDISQARYGNDRKSVV